MFPKASSCLVQGDPPPHLGIHSVSCRCVFTYWVMLGVVLVELPAKPCRVTGSGAFNVGAAGAASMSPAEHPSLEKTRCDMQESI